MKIIADLHIHSRFSQATSNDLSIDTLEKYARIKGVNLLGTGDFTHPKWIQELKEKLTEEEGILRTKNKFPFVLQTEISLIYSQDGKGRRIHNIVLAPSFEVVEQITEYLLKHGRVDYDGRPIFKIPCPEFVESLMSISKDTMVQHIWL
jgi:PHP family Zn ribbon phosphoesterase